MLLYVCTQPDSNLYRGLRRRCLDFEMLVARRKNLDDGSNTSSSVDNQLKPSKLGNDSSRCILPGIGLHLNALAITLRDNKNTKHETLSSGAQKLSFPSSTTPILPPTAGEEAVHESESLTSTSTERETDPIENGVQLAQDASQVSAYLINEEFNQNSPKKKRYENLTVCSLLDYYYLKYMSNICFLHHPFMDFQTEIGTSWRG